MCEGMEDIKRFYADLKYDENEKKNALEMINYLRDIFTGSDCDTSSSQCDTSNGRDDDYSNRIINTVSVIEKNLSLFQLVCEHVDVVTTILDYLNHFVMKFTFGNFSQLEEEEEVTSIIYTLFKVCRQYEVQTFLENSIVTDSTLLEFFLSRVLSSEIHEMIILEDSDIHAVINQLTIIRNIPLDKIWIQEPIKEKFLLLTKKFEDLSYCIQVFRSKQELFTSIAHDKLSILSIWTEDIIAAKNLAANLNRNVLFINTHMDLSESYVLLPYNTKVFDETLLQCFQWQRTTIDNTKPIVVIPNKNFFYDGIWQKSTPTVYRKCNDNLCIEPRHYDIERCIESAKQGVKIWSSWSYDSRVRVLTKFAYTLISNGKLKLAGIVLKWLKFPYFCKNEFSYSQNGRLEITTIRKARGVIIIKEEAEDSLCRHLVQALMTGNCVIIVSSAEVPTLASYCDIFSTSLMPPGVINLISSEILENILNISRYDDYAKKLFSGEGLDIYTNLTISKQIILPVE